MTQIIVDPATLQQLRLARTTLELVDTTGNFIGHFVPATPAGREPTISEVELQRREQRGGGRPLAQILADLEKRA
jgi:hypothetical protein